MYAQKKRVSSGRLTVLRSSHAASSGVTTCSRVNPVGLAGAPPSLSRRAFFALAASPLAAGLRFDFGASPSSLLPSSRSAEQDAITQRQWLSHGAGRLPSMLPTTVTLLGCPQH